jgi:predicted RNase H-like HicB family nuclease
MLIQWSEEDQKYIVTVPELPGCTTHGNTYAEAARQAEEAIESWVTVFRDLGDNVPPPHTYVA